MRCLEGVRKVSDVFLQGKRRVSQWHKEDVPTVERGCLKKVNICFRSGHARTGQVNSGQDKKRQVMSGQVRHTTGLRSKFKYE